MPSQETVWIFLGEKTAALVFWHLPGIMYPQNAEEERKLEARVGCHQVTAGERKAGLRVRSARLF